MRMQLTQEIWYTVRSSAQTTATRYSVHGGSSLRVVVKVLLVHVEVS